MSVLLLVFALAACSDDEADGESEQEADDDDEEKAITIGLDPYDYATVPAYLSKEILEREGYDVEIDEAEVGILFEALANEDLDAFIDIWAPNLQSEYIEKYEGEYEVAGTLYSDMPLGVAVPEYMEDINSIEDLKEHKDQFDGNIYAIEPGSGMAQTTEKMVEEYDLGSDYDIQNSSTAAMLAKAESATDKEEGIVFDAWRPHPMFINMDIKFLDDPKNVWKLDDVQVGVTDDLQDDSPTAYTLFANMDLTLDMVEEWQNSLSFDDAEPEELAEEWVDEHPDKVDEWLEK